MDHLNRSEADWRQRLTPERYRVLREAGTEPAFSGTLTDNKADGVYRCAACAVEVFDATDKVDLGSGWPSFSQPIAADRVTNHCDASQSMRRTETRCARCDSHLGHVFADGSGTAGLRYCLNSLALDFRPRREG